MWIDRLSALIARYKGLPTMLAVLLVVLNFILQIFNLGWQSSSNLLLHRGIVVGLTGLCCPRRLARVSAPTGKAICAWQWFARNCF